MTDIITPQAGWYPDPTDSRAYRWWSGGAWTDHLTAAPSAESVWNGAASGPVEVSANAFDFTEQDANSFSSRYEEDWGNTVRPAGKNRTSLVVVIIGLLSVAGYLGSLAVTYSTIFPLIPGALGLILAVPAFMRARVTGDGLAISLLGVLLSGTGAVLSVLPLLPLLLGLPSQADATGFAKTVTDTVGFHVTVQNEVSARAATDFGQAATSTACPADALPTPGSTFTCTETLADGSTHAVTVTVTDASGAVTWVPAA